MFIKRDQRKIEEILVDDKDERTALKLSKRSSEFQGTIRILCRESKLPALSNLRVLNIYDNAIDSVQGIGALACTPIEEINLGFNHLSTLPEEFGTLTGLKSLWLDDNQIEEFPMSLVQLTNLTSLRLSGNRLQSLPSEISTLETLETLAVDNNELISFPDGILLLTSLKHLWLRQNKITALPDTLGGDALPFLETLSLNSNKLEKLPESLASLVSLQKIYLNGNQLRDISGCSNFTELPSLQVVNLANNLLSSSNDDVNDMDVEVEPVDISPIPASWLALWGEYDPSTGTLMHPSTDKPSVTVNLLGNPFVTSTAAKVN